MSSRKLIWIDVNCDKTANKQFLEKIRSKGFEVFAYNSIENGIKKVCEYKFEIINIIIRGTMFDDFINSIKTQKKNISCTMKIIVFTSSKNKNLVKELSQNDADISSGLLFTTKNIFTCYYEVEKFLEHTNTPEEDEIGEEVFEKIENYEQLILPIYYMDLIKPITREEIRNFNQYLINTYGGEMGELISQLEGNPGMPSEIICKYWVKAYTYQTNFYKTMKKKLQQKKGEFFVPYIKMMYEGIKNGAFKSISNVKIYRGTRISNREIEKIEECLELSKNNNNNIDANDSLPKIILYMKPFQSFTLKKEVAMNFMNRESPKENEKKVIFVVGENSENFSEELFSNAYIKDYSRYPPEEEVLFFPFSCFGIKEVTQENDHLEISLEYLGKYKPVIEKKKPLEKLFEDIPLTQFSKDITDFGLIKYFFKTYWKVVKKIETKEEHPLCLLYLGNNILLISVENLIKIYDIDKDKEINSIYRAQNGINDLLKIDKNKIMISSKDKTIKLFQFTDDYFNMNCLQSIEIHKEEVNETIKLKSNNYYASCSDDKTIKIWELRNEGYGLKKELKGHETGIKSIFSLPNNEIVSASKGRFIKFWNYEQCLNTLEISDYPLHKCISLLDDSIISIGTDKSIIFINFIKKEKIKKVFLDFNAISMLNLFGNLIFAFNDSEKSSLEEYTIYHNNIETNIECIGNGKELNLLIPYIEAIDKNTIATSNVNENFVYLWERTKKLYIFKNKGFKNEQLNIKCENRIQ